MSGQVHGSGLVFPATCLLTAASISSSILAAAVYINQPVNLGENACQALVIAASVVSFIYLGFFLVAARRNESVGSIRPPIRTMHHACFVTLRINIVLWIAAIIATVVLASKDICSGVPLPCTMQKAEAVMAILAFFDAIIILSLLEKCATPFQTPRILRLRPMTEYRVSAFSDDFLLERSASRGSSLDYEKREMEDEYMKDNLKLKQKRVPPPRVLLTARNHTDLTEASLSQRNLSNTRTDSWGSDWTHLATEAGCNSDLSPSNSKYETSSSSSGYSHSSGSSSTRSASSSISSDEWPSAYGNCNSQRSPKAAPSSSIGNYSHRSPLSVMRNAENPEIPIHSKPRLLPVPIIPPIRPSREWNRPQIQRRRPLVPPRISRARCAAKSCSPFERQPSPIMIPAPLIINKQLYQSPNKSHTTMNVTRYPFYTSNSSTFSPSIRSLIHRRKAAGTGLPRKRKPSPVSPINDVIFWKDVMETHMQKIEQGVADRTRFEELRKSLIFGIKNLEARKLHGLGLDLEMDHEESSRPSTPGSCLTGRTYVEDTFGLESGELDSEEIDQRLEIPYRRIVSDQSPMIPELDLDSGILWELVRELMVRLGS